MSELGAAMAIAREALERSETACIGVAELRRDVAEIRKTVKRGNMWTGGIVAVGVAAIGTFGQIQVASIGAAAQNQSKATAERTVERDDDFAKRLAQMSAEIAAAKVSEQTSAEVDRRMAALRRDMESRINRRTIEQ
jgi:hypothetical protein